MDRASSKEALSRKEEDATRLPELGAEGVSTLEGPGDALARPPGRAGESEQLFSLLLRGGTCSVESCVALTRVDPWGRWEEESTAAAGAGIEEDDATAAAAAANDDQRPLQLAGA